MIGLPNKWGIKEKNHMTEDHSELLKLKMFGPDKIKYCNKITSMSLWS